MERGCSPTSSDQGGKKITTNLFPNRTHGITTSNPVDSIPRCKTGPLSIFSNSSRSLNPPLPPTGLKAEQRQAKARHIQPQPLIPAPSALVVLTLLETDCSLILMAVCRNGDPDKSAIFVVFCLWEKWFLSVEGLRNAFKFWLFGGYWTSSFQIGVGGY